MTLLKLNMYLNVGTYILNFNQFLTDIEEVFECIEFINFK